MLYLCFTLCALLHVFESFTSSPSTLCMIYTIKYTLFVHVNIILVVYCIYVTYILYTHTHTHTHILYIFVCVYIYPPALDVMYAEEGLGNKRLSLLPSPSSAYITSKKLDSRIQFLFPPLELTVLVGVPHSLLLYSS